MEYIKLIAGETEYKSYDSSSSTAIARTPKTHFIRFGEPRSGPPSPTGEGLAKPFLWAGQIYKRVEL